MILHNNIYLCYNLIINIRNNENGNYREDILILIYLILITIDTCRFSANIFAAYLQIYLLEHRFSFRMYLISNCRMHIVPTLNVQKSTFRRPRQSLLT